MVFFSKLALRSGAIDWLLMSRSVIKTLGIKSGVSMADGSKIFTPLTPPKASLPSASLANAPVLNSSSWSPFAFVKFLNTN